MNTELFECIAAALQLPPETIAELDEDIALKEYGLDSMHFVQLIVILEDRLNIEILDSDLTVENFASKAAICETLKKYRDQ